MKKKRVGQISITVGLFLFLILISIGHLTTNDASRIFIVPIRIAAIVGVVTFIFIAIATTGLRKRQAAASIIFFGMLLYGITMSILNGAFDIGQENIIINTLVIASGLTLMAMSDKKILFDQFPWHYLNYVFLGLIATIIIGGIELTFPPHFVFDYAPDSKGSSEIVYSQGISQFFGIGSVAAAYFTTRVRKQLSSLAMVGAVLGLLALSLLGGARGDSLAAVIVSLGFLAYKFRFKFIVLSIAAGIALNFYIDDWEYLLDGFVIFNRLTSVGSDDLGHRDFLLNQVLDLLSQEPRCLIAGCGFGYFQHYFNYEFGMYPHNFLAESIIVFGLPISAMFGFLVIGGLISHYKSIKQIDFFVLLFLYTLLVGIKSGCLFGEWFYTAASMYFASIYILKIIKVRQSQRAPRLGATSVG